jgi:Zn-dependent M28 family amino/carboxypeptidase
MLGGICRWTPALLALLVGVTAASGSTAGPVAKAQRAEVRVPVAGIMEHLRALQRIADRNGGNRFSGTAGYDASARYVAARARSAGYRVRLQEFTFPFVIDRSPPRLRIVGAAGAEYRPGRDFATLGFTGSGRVEARVVPVDLLVPSPSPNASTSGCEASDFATFPRGAIALLQRGNCTFRAKVANAVQAGASAAIVFNEGNPGRRELVSATLGPPQVSVPALSASFALGQALRGPGVTVELATDVISETRTTRNVIAESRTGRPDRLVVAGAHLDSVARGPGINDNASGSAVLIEVAEQLAALRPRNRLRFVWWAAEEIGLVGSRHYVERLSPAARRQHALYLNFDMVGSPNFVLFVYDGDGSSSPPSLVPPRGSAAIERHFRGYFASRRIAHRELSLGGSSDHAPFAGAGIPIGGLFTGADGRKSAAQARAFGGRAGRAHDPCYHKPCDTLANVSPTALRRTAGAAADAVRHFARVRSG